MINRSVSHNYVQNQPLSSWTDDTFELKGAFAGVASVNHETNLDNFINELVDSYGVFCDDHYELDLNKLSSPYQLELASLYIESIDREIEWACYGDDQSINSDFLCAMLAMLKDNTPKTRNAFAQVTARNILTYYKETLQNRLDIGCDIYFSNEMNDAGYHSEIDSEDGDVIWGKF